MKKICQITAFALSYHVEVSQSHNYLIKEPLKKFLDIRFKIWDGQSPIFVKDNKNFFSSPILFHQYPPPKEFFRVDLAKLIWVPMWDHAKNFPLVWWKSLPSSLKVIAFSEKVEEMAKKAGLKVFRVKYHIKPSIHNKADFSGQRVLMYWNRTGLVSKRLLLNLCRFLKIDKLIFQETLDPKIDKNLYFTLPSKIKGMDVETLKEFVQRGKYLEAVSRVNIYLAPRIVEGVGLSYLEAIARGCAVFAYNGPAMNEYIIHKKNGYLLKNLKKDRFFYKTAVKIIPSLRRNENQLDERQDRGKILNINLKSLGEKAYEMNKREYEVWRKSLPLLADFIMRWQE